MRGLNLSTFKKMKEDAHSATMIHKDGHTLVIAKSSLPALQRKQLEQLPMHSMAQGGKVQHYDDGSAGVGQDIPYDRLIAQQEAEKQAENSPYGTSGAVANQSPIQGVKLADNGPITPDQVVQIFPQSTQADPTSQVSAMPQGTPQNEIQSKIPGYAEEKAANLAGAQALQTEGRTVAQAHQDVADQIEDLPTQLDYVNRNQAKSNALFKAFQDKEIDPDHYWQSHSKISSGIGLLLSGAGSGATGRDGGVLDRINRGIDQDIDAQKNSQDHAMNLWKMNREALGSKLAADLATKNQLYTGLKYKIDQAAAQAKGPLALANAQAANAKIDQAVGANNFKLALMNPTSDNPDPASSVQFLVPEGRQKDVTKEISEAQNMVRNYGGIKEAFWNAAKEARPLTGGTNTSFRALVPGMHTPAQQAFAARIAPTIQEQEGTVRQMAFDNVDQRMTPKFGDSDADIQTKWNTFLDYAKSKAAAPNAKSFGIDLHKYPTTNTLKLGSEIPDTSGAMTKGGIQYQRQIINGKAYMVPVK